ncbi:MAG: DUF4091 domain-containing protein [Bacilli bacterium]|jgi:hypothetical protein
MVGNKNKIWFLSVCAIATPLLLALFSVSSNLRTLAQSSGAANSLILSSNNPKTGGYVTTAKGSPIYVQDDGVVWNSGGNLAFNNGGYIQTLTTIHGIQTVEVDLVSGSIDLYHGYAEPFNLATPMYGVDYTFSSSTTYTFSSSLPNHIRLRASEDAVVSQITINFDCLSPTDDSGAESLDDGLENSYVDDGSIATYANPSYVLDTSSDNSSRALRLDFKGTANNYIALNTQVNKIKGITSEHPDFTNAILTLKAKFSNNVDNHELEVQAVGSSWEHSNWIVMNSSSNVVGGWSSYSIDFSDINFDCCNDIIRINIKPLGIDGGNKNSAYVLLDEIDYRYHTMNQEMDYESLYDGLENIPLDVGMTNTYISFDNEFTYGRVSRASLVAKPKESIGNNAHYYVTFSPQNLDGFSSYFSDLSNGVLMFEYKPINTKNPATLYLRAIDINWETSGIKEVLTTALKNGWYLFSYDLANLGFASNELIRYSFGFDVETSNVSKSKVYFDNVRVNEMAHEDYTLGLENLEQDGGMSSGCTRSIDYSMTASDASLNSIKCVINNNNEQQSWQNQWGMIHVLTEQQASQMECDSGILECKFLFAGEFSTKKLWLVLVDSGWKGARFKDITPTSLGNGWYQASIDFSTLSSWSGSKEVNAAFDYSDNPIRIGFGFQDLYSGNLTDKTVWVDDMFYYPVAPSNSSSPLLWQSYDTENVRRGDAVIIDRYISQAKPLKFADARNGTSSTQLMIKAQSDIASYLFRPGTLRGSNGDVLPSSCFETLVAKYIYCGTDTNEYIKNGYGYMGVGYYPDALVPMDKIIAAQEDTIADGNQQSIWINCEVPKNQTPGEYTGNGILVVDGTEYTIPMKVVVYNATLSDVNHNKTTILMWWEKIVLAEDHYDRSMRQAYYDFLVDRRMSPDANFDWNTHDEASGMNVYETFAENFANYVMPNDKISTYRIPTDGTQESITGYLSALANRNIYEWNNGNHVNFFDKALFFIVDEPEEPTFFINTEPDDWKTCKNVQTYIANAKSAIAPYLPGYPEILNGLNDIRSITTIGASYDKISGSFGYKDLLNESYLDTPCPQFDHLDDINVRNDYINTFDHVWFYGCIHPQLPYPSYHIDTPLIGQRLIKWMQYDYGFDGTLYYCPTMFTTEDDNNELRDVWTDPMVGNGAGDGQLLYPGSKYNVHGPITSMRMENIRNSMEDYEYFYMLDQNIARYNANTGSSITSCRDLLNSDFSQMFSGTQLLSSGHTSSTGYQAEDFDLIRTYLLQRLEYCY